MGIHMMPPHFKAVLPVTVEVIIKPDAHPEVKSVDGWVRNSPSDPPYGWDECRNEAGDAADDDYEASYAAFRQGWQPPGILWYEMARGILGFDISILPSVNRLKFAKFRIYGFAKDNLPNLSPAINIYKATPANNTSLTPTDFQQVSTVAICDNAISYSNFDDNGWNEFILNSVGIAYLKEAFSGDGIAFIGTREATYDAPDNEPTWSEGSQGDYVIFSFYTAEKVGYEPKLVLRYEV